MKFSKLLFLSFLTLLIVSCSKDDDSKSSNDTSATLVGSWKATDFSYESKSRTEGQGTTIESESTGVAKDLDIVVEFSDDPNTYQVDADYTLEVTTESSGQTIVQEYPIQYTGSGSWNREGDILKVMVDNQENEAEITKLTANTLTYVTTETQTQTQNEITTTVEITETTTFTRQ